MSRLPLILKKNFNGDQQKLFESITGGKRGEGRALTTFLTADGGMAGPFNAMLYSPGFGEAVQNLGEKVRFEGSIDPRLRELAILVVASSWRSSYEWQAHAKIARKVGLNTDIIESIGSGTTPVFSGQAQAEAVVYRFACELVDTRRVTDKRYQEARNLFGESGVVELVTTIGYYTLVSMLLNTFEVPPRDDEPSPFEELPA